MAWSTVTSPGGGGTVDTSTFGIPVAGNLNLIGGVWTAYAPVPTGSTTNPTGYSTTGSGFVQAGKLIFFRAEITFGAAVGSGSYSLTLPAAPRNAGLYVIDGIFYDSSAGSAYVAYMLVTAGSTTCALRTAGAPLATITAASPFTVAAGDLLTFNGVYEAV